VNKKGKNQMAKTHALIVDDDRNNLSILAEMLSFEGIEYTQVQNPAQLDDVLQKLKKVDIIFLDLELPVLNGYQLLEKFKNDARYASVPVVAYTVHVSEINHARQLGFHSFIGKPLDAELFPQQVARILNGERVWATP
jgi:two-component system cell cycle response regulator DivK